MSVDVDAIAGYGIEITEDEFMLLFQKEIEKAIKNGNLPEEEENIDEIWFEIKDTVNKPYVFKKSGSHYTGEYDYYLILNSSVENLYEDSKLMLSDIEGRGIKDKKIEFICDVLWC